MKDIFGIMNRQTADVILKDVEWFDMDKAFSDKRVDEKSFYSSKAILHSQIQGLMKKLPFLQKIFSGLMTTLITPVLGISWLASFGKDCFDTMKSIGFGDLIRHFSSSRRSDRVYLGWFLWHMVWRLFKMQASRQSVKPDEGSGPIGSSLTVLASKSTSNTEIHMSVQVVRYKLLPFGCFFLVSACWSSHYLLIYPS